VVPVLSWLTLAVLLWLEAFAIRTASSTLAPLLVAKAFPLCYALSVRGQLLHARLTRLDRQRSQHRARLAIIDTAPIGTEPSGSVARVAVPVRVTSLDEGDLMTDDTLNPAAILERAAAQLRADDHRDLAASLEQLGSYLSRQAAIQTEALLASDQTPLSEEPAGYADKP